VPPLASPRRVRGDIDAHEERAPETLVLHTGDRSDPATTVGAVPIYRTTSYRSPSPEHAERLFALEQLDELCVRVANLTRAVAENRFAVRVCGGCGRPSIGIERTDDILPDLEQALAAA